MNTLNKLLDTARDMCERKSDAAVAERLKVSRTTVMQWRRGEKRMTAAHLAALVELAKADPSTVVKVNLEEASTPAERRVWGPLWDRLSAAVAAVAPTALILCGTIAYAGADAHRLYIMSRRKLARAVHGSMTTRWQRTLA